MSVPRDPFLADGPLPPPAPRDPNADTVLDPSERGEDMGREATMNELIDTPARPLTGDEKDEARNDPGEHPRTYAPASERVAKDPLPGDREVIKATLGQPPSAESLQHPGDKSDPSELR